MKLFGTVTLYFLSTVFASGQTNIITYSNFRLEEKKLIWQKVFDRPTYNQDSLKRLVGVVLKQNIIFKNVIEISDGFEFDVIDWTLDYKRYGGRGTLGYPTIYRDAKWASKVVIQIKDERYRVTSYDLTYGNMKLNTNYGYGVSGTKDISGKWDETILTKSRESMKRSMFENCDLINNAYLDIFDFKEKRSLKSDF